MTGNNDNQNSLERNAVAAGPFFMLSAALSFAILDIFVKLIGPEYNAWSIGFYRFFGGMILLLIFFGRHKNIYRGNNTPLLIVRGCTGSVAFISIITAIRLLPVSTAIVIFYSYPAFSAIFSFFLHGERMGKLEALCIIAAITGTAVLFDFHPATAGNMAGQIMAVVGAVFAGLTVTLIRTLRKNNGSVIIYLYFCTMGTLVTAPMFGMHYVFPLTMMDGFMVLGIIFSSLIGQLLMNQGFFYCRGWEGGVFMSGEVVLAATAGIVFLGDPVTWRFWTGGAIILVSVAVLNGLMAAKHHDTKCHYPIITK